MIYNEKLGRYKRMNVYTDWREYNMEMQLNLFSKIEDKSICKNNKNKIKMLCDCKQVHPLLISESIHDLVKVTKGHYFVFLDDTWLGILKENAVLV